MLRVADERTAAEGGGAVLGEELLRVRHDREVEVKWLMSTRALLDYRLLIDFDWGRVDTRF